MILLDTDTLTHFAHGNDNVRRAIERSGSEQLGITLITRYEMLRGRAESLLKAADEEQLHRAAGRFTQAESLVSAFVTVGFDEKSIILFGQLRRQKSLNKMGRADMLIACITLAQGALLVTRNTRDFAGVVGLKLENWVD